VAAHVPPASTPAPDDGPDVMRDWRGVQLTPRCRVVYPNRQGSSMWMVEAEIVELHPRIDNRWNFAMQTSVPTQVGQVTVRRIRTTEPGLGLRTDEPITERHLRVGIERMTVVEPAVVEPVARWEAT
jgi:hypothetical protein